MQVAKCLCKLCGCRLIFWSKQNVDVCKKRRHIGRSAQWLVWCLQVMNHQHHQHRHRHNMHHQHLNHHGDHCCDRQHRKLLFLPCAFETGRHCANPLHGQNIVPHTLARSILIICTCVLPCRTYSSRSRVLGKGLTDKVHRWQQLLDAESFVVGGGSSKLQEHVLVCTCARHW